jgi:hypothetical protein
MGIPVLKNKGLALDGRHKITVQRVCVYFCSNSFQTAGLGRGSAQVSSTVSGNVPDVSF